MPSGTASMSWYGVETEPGMWPLVPLRPLAHVEDLERRVAALHPLVQAGDVDPLDRGRCWRFSSRQLVMPPSR